MRETIIHSLPIFSPDMKKQKVLVSKSRAEQELEDQEYLSPEGHAELAERLYELKTKRRVEIAEHLEYAKSLGDLSENVEYSEAKEEQMVNEAEIAKLEDLLARAVVVSHRESDTVRIGSTVACTRDISTEKVHFTIVGKEEADPSRGKISHDSPLGRAFLGKKKNETFLVSTPRGEVTYRILDIA